MSIICLSVCRFGRNLACGYRLLVECSCPLPLGVGAPRWDGNILNLNTEVAIVGNVATELPNSTR